MSGDLATLITLALLLTVFYHQVRKKIPGFRIRYYNSVIWRRRSRFCRRLNGGRCKTLGCRMAAHVAHHKSYRYFASWTPIELVDLVPLCKGCHMGLHQVAKGRLTQAKKKNPYAKYDDTLKITTDDWVAGRIRREIAA